MFGRKHNKRHERRKEHFHMEGNNGGDYIILKQVSEDELIIEIGSCCVVEYHHKIPVELLTRMITEIGFEIKTKSKQDTMTEIGKKYLTFNNEEYNKKLIAKITPLNLYGEEVSCER